MPAETWLFKQALEATYRHDLGRPGTPTPVDQRVAHTWMRRYLRYRAHECGHDEAAPRVFRQIDGEDSPPLCGRPAGVSFPGHDDAVRFRHRLEERLRNATRKHETTTFVDVVGDAVWLQEYLRARLQNRSHAVATAGVLAAIRGLSAP